MSYTSKQIREIEAHNRLAEAYAEHREEEVFRADSVIQGLLDRSGDLNGKTILECGCGRGLFTEYLIQQGAKVVAFDISDKLVELAQQHLGPNENLKLLVGALEVLDLEPESFDLILGLDILHHIDLNQAMPKLRQWLKPGGKALFVENLGFNPLLTLSRQLIAGRFGVPKYGTDDERPLSHQDVAVMQKSFKTAEIFVPQMVFLQIFSRNVLRYRHLPWLQQIFEQLDGLLYRFPQLHWLSYKAVVILH